MSEAPMSVFMEFQTKRVGVETEKERAIQQEGVHETEREVLTAKRQHDLESVVWVVKAPYLKLRAFVPCRNGEDVFIERRPLNAANRVDAAAAAE